jgi:hypothetical protein
VVVSLATGRHWCLDVTLVVVDYSPVVLVASFALFPLVGEEAHYFNSS